MVVVPSMQVLSHPAAANSQEPMAVANILAVPPTALDSVNILIPLTVGKRTPSVAEAASMDVD